MRRGWVVSPDYRLVIETLRSTRLSRDIGQRELARRLGKPPSFINKIEQLERRLDVLEFVAITEALGIDAAEMLGAIRLKLPQPIQL